MPDEPPEAAASRSPNASNARGVERARSGDTAGAEAAFREADEAGSPAGAFNLGQLLAERGDGRGAIAALQRSVSRGHVSAGFALGTLLEQAGDSRGSIEAYRVAAERGHPTAAYQLGRLYSRRGDSESARAAFAMGDELGHASSAFELGEILEQIGDRDGAIAAYRRAGDRGFAGAHVYLGTLLVESGDTKGAIAAFRLAGEAGLAVAAKLGPLYARAASWRWTRHRLAWTVGTIEVLSALVIVGLFTLSHTPNTTTAATTPTAPHSSAANHSTEGRTAPATRAATGATTSHSTQRGRAPAPPSPTAVFTAKQSALLDNVPGTAHVRCVPRAEEHLPHAGASIRCFSSSAGITVRYYRYSSLPLLGHLLHNYRAWFASHHRLRDCAGLSHGKYYQGSADSTVAGRWTCFYNDRTIPDSACIDWVDYNLMVFGSACQADENFTALARWWRNAGPVPISTHDLANRYYDLGA